MVATSDTNDPADFGPSFWGNRSGGTLTGGTSATYDSGTVTVTVNGSPISVGYGQGSTTTTIASALAAALTNSIWVNASA
ncbi:MAG TPA: hypothetical protein VFU76_00410, partial [Terriglobales bacterium]|nr:hypothetical protein [Terriglobales bacterium]